MKKMKIKPAYAITGLILIVFMFIVLVKSIQTIGSGERGAMFYKWTSGVDTAHVMSEGTHMILPWNDLIVYDVRQKKEDMALSVLDKKGLTVKIAVTVQYHPMPTKIGLIDVNIGRDYKDVVVIPESKSAIREVIGKFTAEELYSTKRAELQFDCEKMISATFLKNNLILDAINIKDVDLPKKISDAILLKQEQDQKNLRAEKLQQEAIYKANAKKQDAIGDSIQIVTVASAEAQAIKLKQEQLKKSPQYVELKRVEAFLKTDGKSWYGENNIFGSVTAIVKGLK